MTDLNAMESDIDTLQGHVEGLDHRLRRVENRGSRMKTLDAFLVGFVIPLGVMVAVLWTHDRILDLEARVLPAELYACEVEGCEVEHETLEQAEGCDG